MCKCHKINPNRRGSYIDSPDWMRNRKATINSINKKESQCFQYTLMVALNHEQIGNNPEIIKKVKPSV